ncbi:23S rRNA (pseudouridine(1915)-N(3))-methyltransferase RlmH [soil metagenome]
MLLAILAVGQRMPGWVDEAFGEYAKRMPSELRIVITEIKAEARSASRTAAQVMALEAGRIEQAVPRGARIVVLDERGETLDTKMLAAKLDAWRLDGRDVALVIGGADGLDPEFKQRADERVRLSSLTLPHGLARVLLAEALYRAWTVTTGHPYHRV